MWKKHPKASLSLVLAGAAAAGASLMIPIAPHLPPAVEPEVKEEKEMAVPAAPPPLHTFIEVTDGCGFDHSGACANVRSGPSAASSSVLQLRTGIVLPVASTTITDPNGRKWYKVEFQEWLRYPERISGDWYVAEDSVRAFEDLGALDMPQHATSTKRIEIDRSEQMLRAYDGNSLVMESTISTGRDLTPTPRGTFTVYRKTPSRYMQGPLPGISAQYYDLPGVPWNLYFTKEGGAIHGAYWHNSFGTPWSHGCVNLPLDAARKMYEWADLGTQVIVRD